MSLRIKLEAMWRVLQVRRGHAHIRPGSPERPHAEVPAIPRA
jgi:hypothetical protein